MAASPEQLKRRLERLKTLRSPHEGVWRDCLEHSFPIRASGLQGGAPMSAQQVQDKRAKLLHSISTDAGRTLAAAIVMGAVPSSSVWGLLKVAGADEEGLAWLDAKGKQLHEEVHASNFDSAVFECALDLVGAGWFALYIGEDREQGGFSFEQWPISQVYASTTKPGGRIDTVFREYTLTAEQAVAEFGETGVSQSTLKKSAVDPDAPITICHAIYPRQTYVVNARLAKNLPIASCHFEVDTQHLLRESGYHEMPVIVPRWAVIPGSVYAVGPMSDALPPARQLNKLIETDTLAGEIAVSGMWIAEDDGVLNPRAVKVGPRKIIVANSVDSMKPLTTGSNWQLATDRITRLEDEIRRVLMADQLPPVNGPVRTATEIQSRINLIRQLLGPIYGRLQAEWLAPMVERCFGLMYRAGVFGRAPASLGGQSLRVRYNNPLARAQRGEDVAAVERMANVATVFANLAAAGVPAAGAAMDVVDWDETMRTVLEGVAVPLTTVHSKDDVQALRQQRAEQQQQAQQAAQQQQMQTMAADAAMQRAAKAA